VDPPLKRRATRALKSTPVKRVVELSVEPLARDTRQSNNPVLPPPITTPKKSKGRAKISAPDYPDVPRLRASRRRPLGKEEVVLDSQPEVVATPSIASMIQWPGPKDNVEVEDSNAGASQAEEDWEKRKPESQKEPNDPLTKLREAVAMLAAADLGGVELREAEDEVFKLYVKLRERQKGNEPLD